MTKLIHKTGNIFMTDAPAIGHGVNVHGVMGSGIAVQFRRLFPDMYQEYRKFCKNGALKPGMVYAYHDEQLHLLVMNIASQDAPGPNARIEWLREGVEKVLVVLDNHNISRIALPRIGAGVGGLDWDEVEKVLTELAEAHTADIEVWTLPTAS
jgi:O-acetyl-ADP-ribose deacetylase (regulator of RNase III)